MGTAHGLLFVLSLLLRRRHGDVPMRQDSLGAVRDQKAGLGAQDEGAGRKPELSESTDSSLGQGPGRTNGTG